MTIDDNGCWIYGSNPKTYGTIALSRRNGMRPAAQSAHRFFYETLVGPIDEGLELHHRCEVKSCVNPNHLVPLTHDEHIGVHTMGGKPSKATPADKRLAANKPKPAPKPMPKGK